MLTIAETSGLIAAVVVIVQYVLPAATAVVLVRCAGNESTAVTWSVLNRYISNTIWPHLLRADAVSGRHVSTSTTVLTWTSTVGAALLVLASVLTPLGLSEKILPGDHQLVEFQYVKDPGPWGTVTMPRPNFKFSRYCEVGLRINCPGQYQGIYMNETEPGKWRSVETDENSTINITIPRNYTEMFRSATSDQGNTVSGMFDMQYRRWAIDRTDIIERGQPYVRGKSRHIENLLVEDQILLKEGLIIDMRTNPGIGFRNHSIPLNLRYGGVWTEDLTWIEPITQCADTNISAEMRTETNVEDFGANVTLRMIDRGAFSGLQYSDLESRIWIDNQTLDLFAHAHKAARMHNVLVASSLDISLPLNDTTQTIPPRPIGTDVVSSTDFGSMKTSSLKGLGGTSPHVPGYDSDNSTSGNSSSQTSLYIPRYSDGMKKLLALNYTAIEQICEGHYEVATSSLDLRAGSINNTAIKCGAVFGAPADGTVESLSASTFTGVQMARKNLYVCATAYKASIKTVHFRHNGTSEDFAGLEVIDIVAKTYSSEISKPLWAVENSGDRRMGFDPLWGITSDAFEDTEGFDTLRSESLWLPTSPSMTDGIGQTEGGDALAAAGGFLLRLANLYQPWIDAPDFSGAMEFALQERWSRLSQNHTTVSSIPSLILTNGLAAGLVGTKTSFSSRYVEWPASLAVENSTRGLPRAKVQVYRRVIQYDIRYAIPSFLILALVLASVVAAVWSAITSSSIVCTMQRLYNQTSAGRLAVTLLQPDQSDPTQSSHAWVAKEGSLRIAFGMISQSEDDNFCRIVQNGESGSEMPPETVTEAAKTERGHLLPETAQ